MRALLQRIEPGLARVAGAVLPLPVLRILARALRRPYRIPIGRVRLGTLDGVIPISRHFGFDRGRPVDRHYIEAFLARHAADIRGRVLEVKDDAYTARFGASRVERSDVIDIDAANPSATIVADLAGGSEIPSDAFDCIVVTQTLHLVYDLPLAASALHRALRPGGVLLLTVPGISKVYRKLADTWYWSFTEASLARLFGEVFPPAAFQVEAYGNVFAATAFLQGLATEEVAAERLNANDPEYPVVITLRAVKPGSQS